MGKRRRGEALATPQEWAKSTRKWRWISALVLGVAATFLALLWSYVGPSVCQDVASGGKVLRVCTKAPLEVLALLFMPTVLLLLPDFSEITFLGIGLKQRVDETAAEAKEAQRSASVAQEGVGAANAALVAPAVAAVAKEEGKLPAPQELDLPSGRAELVERLMACWEKLLQPYTRLARRRQSPGWENFRAHLGPASGRSPAVPLPDPRDTLLLVSLPALDEETVEKIGQWAEDNWYLINAVEVTYNTAVAGEELTSERLKEVLRIGEELRRRLPEAAGRHQARTRPRSRTRPR